MVSARSLLAICMERREYDAGAGKIVRLTEQVPVLGQDLVGHFQLHAVLCFEKI